MEASWIHLEQQWEDHLNKYAYEDATMKQIKMEIGFNYGLKGE